MTFVEFQDDDDRPAGVVTTTASAIALIVGTTVLALYVRNLPAGARPMLWVVTVLLATGAVAFTVQAVALLRERSTRQASGGQDNGSSLRASAIELWHEGLVLVAMLIYAFTLPVAGFWTASVLLMCVAGRILGVKHWLRTISVAIILVTTLDWLFFQYLALRPLGWSPWTLL